MNSKDRILAALRGNKADKVPFSPFLAYWWEFQSDELKAKGMYSFMKSVGADPLLRGGESPMFKVEFVGCEIVEQAKGIKRYVEHRTPIGTLYTEYTYVANGDTWFLTKHPIETIEQLHIFKCLMERAKITSDYGMYDKLTNSGKNDMLLLPVVGVFYKSAFQSLLEQWIGTENLIFMLYDDEDEIMDTLKIMWEKDAETVEISADSPAEGFIFWEDSSTTNISPDIFNRCSAPELRNWSQRIHKRGKLLVHHACGHLRDLIVPMSQTGIDVIESITPPPTGNITIEHAFNLLPENIALIGGIDPVFLLDCSLDELEKYAIDLLNVAKGRRFVMANSDSCPPGVSIEKFQLLSSILR